MSKFEKRVVYLLAAILFWLVFQGPLKTVAHDFSVGVERGLAKSQ